MKHSHALAAAAIALAALILPHHTALAEQQSLRGGSYEITARLELPHLERWAVDRTATLCLPGIRGNGEIPVPVLSANNPFAGCSAANIVGDGSSLQYDVVCPGRGAAKAHASYTLSGDRFAGNVAMVMGAKNMTMTEIQHARRVGDCAPGGGSAVERGEPAEGTIRLALPPRGKPHQHAAMNRLLRQHVKVAERLEPTPALARWGRAPRRRCRLDDHGLQAAIGHRGPRGPPKCGDAPGEGREAAGIEGLHPPDMCAVMAALDEIGQGELHHRRDELAGVAMDLGETVDQSRRHDDEADAQRRQQAFGEGAEIEHAALPDPGPARRRWGGRDIETRCRNRPRRCRRRGGPPTSSSSRRRASVISAPVGY